MMIIIWSKKSDNLCISKCERKKSISYITTRPKGSDQCHRSNQFAFKKSTTWMHHVRNSIIHSTWVQYKTYACERRKKKQTLTPRSSIHVNVTDIGLRQLLAPCGHFFVACTFAEMNCHRLTFDCYISCACHQVLFLIYRFLNRLHVNLFFPYIFYREFNKLFIAIAMISTYC